jgi:hypothetical protein
MTLLPDDQTWLPQLIRLDDYGGSWGRYLDAIYSRFCNDFIATSPTLLGLSIRLMQHPPIDGKDVTFWHLTSEGPVEENRTPDFRRCERIAWPRAIIEAVGTGRIKMWKNLRGRHKRIVLSLPDFSYVVVLEERKTYYILWTAYHVEHESRRFKLRRESVGV